MTRILGADDTVKDSESTYKDSFMALFHGQWGSQSLKVLKKATSMPILLIHCGGHTNPVIGTLTLQSEAPFSLYHSAYEANQMVAWYTWKQRKETCIVLRNISSR